MWSSLLPFLGGIISNIVNSVSVRKNNAANIQLARERNAQQRAESELAYQRSKPTSQVNNLMAAGMSKAGALSTLNGGGSYTPAAISTAQTQASQVDTAGMFDGIIAAAENSKNRQLQKELQENQIKAAKEQQQAQFDENERQRKHELLEKEIDTANQVQHDYIEYEKHKESLSMQERLHSIDNALRVEQFEFDKEVYEYNQKVIDSQIEEIKSRTKLNYLNADSVELDNWRKNFENMQLPALAKLTYSKNYIELMSLVQQYRHAEDNHTLDKERKEIENRIRRLTADSEISWTNVSNELNTYLGSKRLGMYRDDDKYFGGFIGATEYFIQNMLPSIVRIK